jgi:PhnB protein
MPSTVIHPYLFFAGRCDEAIEFYSDVLGARLLQRMTFSESPEPAPDGMLQEGFEDKVMHATIDIGGAILMASDGSDDKARFDGFRLSLALPTEEDAQRVFGALAEEGEVEMPLGKTFWSPCFGMVTDQFGVGWMVSVDTTPST